MFTTKKRTSVQSQRAPALCGALPDSMDSSIKSQLAVANASLSEYALSAWTEKGLVASAATRTATTTAGTTTFARLITVAAKYWPISARFKGHGSRLATTRTNHRCSLCWSRTVAGASPLVVLLCLTASLATLWGRITTFLEERLIRSCEGEVLPAIAARK